MEGWGKIGVQSASVLYPNSCYNESCYIEVHVYHDYTPKDIQFIDLKLHLKQSRGKTSESMKARTVILVQNTSS